MSESFRAEAQVLREQLHKARRAEVPDLAEVRKYREMFYEFLADRTLEIMEADRYESAPRVKVSVDFDVISNDSPGLSASRGLCSPVKTEEIRQFEKAARKVFGDVEFCGTAWRDGRWN